MSCHYFFTYIEGWLKIYYLLFLVYSQIWLNLSRDDCHLSYKQKFLATVFKSSLANGNLPRDARHSDSIRKLGKKKNINNWAIHPYWWIQMMMDWLMDDEPIDGWTLMMMSSDFLFFPQLCDVTKVAIIRSKV